MKATSSLLATGVLVASALAVSAPPAAATAPTPSATPYTDPSNPPGHVTTGGAVPSVTIMDPPVCGEVTLSFNNGTNSLYVFDYKVDRERPKFPPAAAGTIQKGPLKGQAFGPRYNLVRLDGKAGQHGKSITLRFPKNSGTHTVAYRLAEGAEQNNYFGWKTVSVPTYCKPPAPASVTPAAPSVKQPHCSDKRAIIAVPNVPGVRYFWRDRRNIGHLLKPGDNVVTSGRYAISAVAQEGYKMKRGVRTSWQLTLDKAPTTYICS
ncbi:hypothetical protein [Microbispora bryophytorum]|uniref:Ig-like domain-containing protein n=1 Tax=Microbispora bryophytorum subsp. camponoti TaxID=1677852 RepID=A0ABR8LEX6_9ACTN|nr:hypothetical protein [Microbispora camponoti]MBD3147098.1 hypothetical protein [Microbispora camponoti]